MNTCDTFHSMAGQKFVKEIVSSDQYLLANTFSTLTQKIVHIIFNGLGAFMSQVIGYPAIFMINALSFTLSAIVKVFIRYEFFKKTVGSNRIKKSLFLEMKTTWILLLKSYRYVFFIFILLGALLNFILAPLSLYIPIFIKEYLHLSTSWYGIILIMIPVGNILYSAIAMKLSKWITPQKSINIAYYLLGVSLIIWAMIDSFIGGSIALLLLGFSLAMSSVNLSTLLQQNIPTDIFGKASGLASTILGIAIPMGYIIGSIIANILDLRYILFVSGCMIALLTCIFSIKGNKQ